MGQESLSQRMKRIFLNETGQMTVFVALIFQVLFVFFAMVINIGLLVHDKINLQNAVDLGAYYGAQRQAEILNEIAHVNYQIRQDNKLLAWRYRVLGTLGRTSMGGPPATTTGNVAFGPNQASDELPSVCVANAFWREATANSSNQENYCYKPYDSPNTIVKIPPLVISAPFVPGVVAGGIQIGALRDVQDLSLANQGPLNWAFSGQMMMAYRMALASRKAVIQKLRQNLTTENMTDQSKLSVFNGVLATVKKNLTVANLNAFDDQAFGFKNGLATDACKGPNNDGAGTIMEMRTMPVILYTYSDNTGGSGYIVGQAAQNNLVPLKGGQAAYDPQGLIQYFLNNEPSDSVPNTDVAGLAGSSLGFEKNPWCMAYVGVHASTSPRKPFAPFGAPIQLVARAFAQPFGGRIGPWYRSLWPQGSPTSAGGARVDPLSTPRLLNNANEGGEVGPQLLPNYSRYPGDALGVRAFAHQAGTRGLIAGSFGRDNPAQLSYLYFVNFDRITQTGDPLAWDNRDGADPKRISASVKNIRDAETAAIAPDLFDATYYSIDLNYATNYKALNGDGSRFENLGVVFGSRINVAPDLGGRNGTDYEGFNVASQIQVANQALDQTLRNTLGYYIWDKAHVLTSWAPVTNSNFGFPTARFGKCDAYAAKAAFMIPGTCTNGGRVGYSVRIISRDHLLNDKWAIGGEGQVGPIKNPPSPDF